MAGYIGLSDLEPELRSLLESPQPVEVESATNALKRLGYEVEPAEKRRAWVEIMGKYEKRHAFLLAGGVPGGAERRWFQCESDDQCKLGHDPCGGHWGANVEFIDEVTKWSIEDAWSCLLTPELDYLNANHLSCVLGFCRIGSGSSLELR